MNGPTLLPYQQAQLEALRAHPVVVYEKSRRIGATWATAGFSVMRAAAAKSAGGMDVLYTGFNLELAREFVDACADWARAMAGAAAEVEEFLFDDGKEREGIKAFRISFASGFEIVALSSKPRSFRGRQGFAIIDEAAFHGELEELIKAAMALLMWGGRVLILSTHDGVDNAFNQLIEECRAGRRPYLVLRTTFDEAVRDGLYRRICETRGSVWSADAEAAWAAEIRAFYGDAASEELDCVPRASGGKYLPRALLEARAVQVPVLRWACDDAFVDLPADVREATAAAWFRDHVLEHLRAMGGTAHYLGEDFGRSADLTVLWPTARQADLRCTVPCIVEMRNVPFSQQEQIVFLVIDSMSQFRGGAFDARGNGQQLAESARQRYGADAIAEVMLTEGWYREHVPPLRTALEDDMFEVPKDAAVIDDFRAFEVVNGVPRIVGRSGAKGTKRHGDAAIAGTLALFASRTLDAGPITASAHKTMTADGGYADHSGGSFRTTLAGW